MNPIPRTHHKRATAACGFTLIEVLVVISIIGVLVSILMPALRRARLQARAATCASQLHTLGQGWYVYAGDNRGMAVPARLPLLRDGGFGNPANRYRISTGKKYRPRWPALMQGAVGALALRNPKVSRNRQNYHSAVYTCPSVAERTDERNSSYGYNYQFLGSARRNDMVLRNLPVPLARIRATTKTVVMGDSDGSAAAFPRRERGDYSNGGREVHRKGNYGWLLDPPRLEPTSSRAGGDFSPRSGPDPRHLNKANFLFADAHARSMTLADVGYGVRRDGAVVEEGFGAHNRFFSGTGRDDGPP